MKNILLTILLLVPVQAFSKEYEVYGRDMDYPTTNDLSFFNKYGHLGIEYKGKVYNMIPGYSRYLRTENGSKTSLRITNKNNFKNAGTNFWGIRHESYRYNRYKVGQYLERVKTIGSDYTFRAVSRSPRVSKNRKGEWIPKRGLLRCDTLVGNALKTAYKHHNKWTSSPKLVFNRVKYK